MVKVAYERFLLIENWLGQKGFLVRWLILWEVVAQYEGSYERWSHMEVEFEGKLFSNFV